MIFFRHRCTGCACRLKEILSLTVDLELPLARDPAPAGTVVALAAEVAVELLADVLEQQLRGVDVAQPLRLPVVVAQRELRRGGINLMQLSEYASLVG